MECKDKSYFLAKHRNTRYRYSVQIGQFLFQYNDKEPFVKTVNNKTVLLFGVVVDSHGTLRDVSEVASFLIKSQNIMELIDNSKRLAGRFIICFSMNDELYFLPDASCSIPVSYTTPNYEVAVSSNPKIIADCFGYQESRISIEIKSQADPMYPLPYDLSMYDEIKIVIPNHYLDCKLQSVIRYYPSRACRPKTTSQIVRESAEILSVIAEEYSRHFKLSIPLTAGIDSRTVLAIFRKYISQIPIYTFRHEKFTESTSDVLIPKRITERYNLNYYLLEHIPIPSNVSAYCKRELGSCYNEYIAQNAYTYFMSDVSNHFFLSGDIAPIVKSNFGKKMPEVFAVAPYLVTKTHNYSGRNKREVSRWIKNVSTHSKKSKVSKFDLFFWEHRIGRWVQNNLMNYDLLTESLNVFNCRELLELWLSVSRAERVDTSIHEGIIKLLWPELLSFPINPQRKYKYVEKNSFVYYIGSLVSHYLNGRRTRRYKTSRTIVDR